MKYFINNKLATPRQMLELYYQLHTGNLRAFAKYHNGNVYYRVFGGAI